MPRQASIDHILELFARRGHRIYEGEGVTQRGHALQCATLAERAGAPPALVSACLLHDVGHLYADHGETPTARGVDDRHQHVAAAYLTGLFDAAVTEPIRLHVEAKRYLCAIEPGYMERLSADSVRSLQLQGGPLMGAAVDAFAALPFAADAVALRCWDEAAKDPALETPPIEHFVAALCACARA